MPIGNCFTTERGSEFVQIISSCSLKKPLSRESDMKESLASLQNFYFGILKLTKTPILPNCQVANGFL